MRISLRGFVLAAMLCGAAGVGGQKANPAGYGGAPAMMVAPQVVTPDFRGMTLQEAQAANVLVPANGAQADTEQHKIFSKLNTAGPTDGVVDSQTPVAGTKVYPGREMATLTMKVAQITVPLLTGMSVAEARLRLEQSSLVLGQVSGDSTQRIASQAPAAGASVPASTVVNVVMTAPVNVVGGVGPQVPTVAEVRVPNVLTLREGTAVATLLKARLGKPAVLGPASGVVVKQTPEAGTMVAEGSRVRLTMGQQMNDILVVPQKSPTWGWYAAGGVVLLGAIGAFVVAKPLPIPPKPRPISVPPVTATMVAKSNRSSAKVQMKSSPAMRWSVQLRDKRTVGQTTVKGEVEGWR